MMRFRSIAASFLFLAIIDGAAFAASGTAMGVKPAAEAELKGDTRTLRVGADIFLGDRVVTGPQGQVQILFSDRTELVVGPRSALVIEDYLLRDDGSAGKLAVNALAGTFRFVTGGAPKDRYEITTPTGTIGVRGTAFDFFVGGGETDVMLYHGAVEICSNSGQCVVLSDMCFVGEYGSGDAAVLGHADGIGGDARDTLRGMFRYAVSQSPLMSAFRVNNAERCLRRPTGGGLPGTESEDNEPTQGNGGGTPGNGGGTPGNGGGTPGNGGGNNNGGSVGNGGGNGGANDDNGGPFN